MHNLKTYLLIVCLLCCNILFSQTTNTSASNKDSNSTIIDSTSQNIKKNLKSKIDSITNDSINKAKIDDDKKIVFKKEDSPLRAPVIKKVFSLTKIFWACVFLIVGFFFIRFICKVIMVIAEKQPPLARMRYKSFVPIIRIVFWLLLIVFIIQGIFHPPVETLLALGASLGLAVGFALQDILKNVFGGLVTLFDKPFKIGDKIEVGNYYGEVVEIGLRSTRIVTPDDSLVSVPNAEIVNQSVSNSNAGENNCQVVAEMYLPIDIDTQSVREIALESARVSKYIFLNKPIVALFFNEIKNNRPYLKLRLKAYVLDIRHEFAFKSDMTEITMRELIKRGILKPSDFNNL